MDDFQQQAVKPISDDQELAEVLAGVGKSSDVNLDFEATPVNVPTLPPIVEDAEDLPVTDEQPFQPETPPMASPVVANISNDELENIKKDALRELRPLVDKLELSAEERFDIYLLLLRSTDDTTLIAPAHATAQQIENESKRAEALLDIIKEIDFLSTPVPKTI